MNQADQQQQTDSDEITRDQEQGHQQGGDQQGQVDQQTQDGQQEGEDNKPRLTPQEIELQRQQRRIDRLTRNKYQSQAQIQQLQAELARHQGGADDQQAAADQSTHTDLRQQAKEVIEQERFNARCDDLVRNAEVQYTDFRGKISELAQELPLFDPQGRPVQILHTILDADDPAAILYHLGSNPDEAAELAEMTPHQQMRHLIKIEQSLSDKPNTQPGQPAAKEAKPVTKAPAPIEPNRSASGQFSKPAEAMTDAEWWASQRKS